MKIIKESEIVNAVEYLRHFDWKDDPGSGFSFPCDEYGNVNLSDKPEAKENYEKCLSGEYDVVDLGVQKYEWTYREPAVGLCNHCNAEVELYGFTNTCECGTDYNWAGQELAPREFWGEETGESWWECY